MSDTRVDAGIRPSLTIHPSPRRVAVTGLAIIAVAIATIASLGAGFYFYALPQFKALSMTWKLAIGSVGVMTIVSKILRKPELAITVVAIGIIASLGASFYFYALPLFKTSLTWEIAITSVGITALAYRVLRKSDTKPESSSIPEYSEETKHLFSTPEKVRERFSTVRINGEEEDILFEQSALEFVQKFAKKKEFLKATLQGMLSNSESRIDFSSLFEEIEDQDTFAFSAICKILKKDQGMLVKVLTSCSWKSRILLFRTLLNLFNYENEELIGAMLDAHTGLKKSGLSIFLGNLASSNEIAASKVILSLREQKRLQEILKEIDHDLLYLFFPLAKFLTQEECSSFCNQLVGSRRESFDRECLRFLMQDSRPSPLFDSDSTLKLEELSPFELAIYNSTRNLNENLFTPMSVVKKFLENLSEDQLAKAFGNMVQRGDQIEPWMSEKLVSDLVFESEYNATRQKCVNALVKCNPERIRAVLLTFITSNTSPWFFSYEKESIAQLLGVFCDWAIDHGKLEILQELFVQIAQIDRDRSILIESLIILCEDNHDQFNKILSNLTMDQCFTLLLDNFWIQKNWESKSRVFPLLLKKLYLAPKGYQTFIESINDHGVFNTFSTSITMGEYDSKPEWRGLVLEFARELEKQEKIRGNLFVQYLLVLHPNS